MDIRNENRNYSVKLIAATLALIMAVSYVPMVTVFRYGDEEGIKRRSSCWNRWKESEGGSGKSTLLKLLLALYSPKAGSICIGERDYRKIESAEIWQLP